MLDILKGIFMNILEKSLNFFAKKEKNLPNIDDFLDTQAGVWCLGPVPKNLKFEIAANINAEINSKKPFSEEFIKSIVTDQEGLNVIKLAIQIFLHFSKTVIGTKSSDQKGILSPWCQALCISPNLSVNASAQLSSDPKAMTVFYTINAGVFIALAHRLLAIFSKDGFMKNPMDKPTREITETIKREPVNGSWCSLKPKNVRDQATVAWVTAFAAMIILHHEMAHFLCGHLGFLKSSKNLLKLKEIDEATKFLNSAEIDFYRRLELDADERGGRAYGLTMREFDHPAPGEKDGRNERFYIFTLLAATTTFIVFEEYAASPEYYPPALRINHFLGGFFKEFFAQPMSPEGEQSILDEMLNVISHVDARYSDLGWGVGFDFSAAQEYSKIYLNKDITARTELIKTLEQFMPHIWPKERNHNR